MRPLGLPLIQEVARHAGVLYDVRLGEQLARFFVAVSASFCACPTWSGPNDNTAPLHYDAVREGRGPGAFDIHWPPSP